MHRPGEHDPEPDRPDAPPLPGDEVPDQPIDDPPPPPGKHPPVTARASEAPYVLRRARRIRMIH